MIDIFLTTLKIATAATILNLPFALFLGWILSKKNFRGKFLLDIFVSLPLALPPVVIGYLLLLLLGSNNGIGAIIKVDIVFTWVAAAIAAALVSFPLMLRSIVVSMNLVDGKVEQAARVLGASEFRTFLLVTMPLSYQGIMAGIFLGFVRALSEFGATIIVAGNIPGKTQTVPLAIYGKIQLGENVEVLELISLSVLLAVISLVIHNYLSNKSSLKKQ
jgi:molybdate transport system permease protein|tara:strand:+ start:1199 stop:1852 length:654 start_codon:yes stop_codon:yes gene_type:complete